MRYRIILLFVLFAAFINTAYAIDPNLVAWWEFEEGGGFTTNDSAGSNDGSLFGEPKWVTGQIGSYALDFEGNDGVYIGGSAGTGSPLNIYNSDLTISAWVKPATEAAQGTIVARAKPLYITYSLGISSGVAYINTYLSGPGNWNLSGGPVLKAGTWYHVVGVLNRSTGRGQVYVNGVKGAEGALGPNPLSNDAITRIGCRNYASDLAFDGSIDDVRIYNRALSAPEIEQICREGFAGKAFGPTPYNEATGVGPNVVLTWISGSDANSHDVYFGTDFNDVNDSLTPLATTDVNNYDPCGLDYGTTYYWRIDEVNDANAASPWYGDVWSFTTISIKATNPNPSDGAYPVNLDAILSWSSSPYAVSHDVYLGTDFNDVNDSLMPLVTTDANSYDPCGLDYGTTYYWRIDAFDGSDTYKSDVWSFTTLDAPSTHIVGWWEFEEGGGLTAYDSAGSNHGTLQGDPVWTAGQIGGGLDLDGSGDYVLVADSDSISVGGGSYTLSAWIYPDSITSTKTIMSKVKDGADKEYALRVLDGALHLDMEKDSNNQYARTSTASVTVGSWQHVAVTFDSVTKIVIIYYNGSTVTSTSNINTLPDQLSDDLYIGRFGGTYQDGDFDGILDDVRIYNRSLTATEIEQLYQEWLGGKAFCPNPNSGQTGVDPNVVLTWMPGSDAEQHDVYLGTDFNDVNDSLTPLATTDVNSYDPCGLDYNTTYYWRIDEVNDANPASPWYGYVWGFTTRVSSAYTLVDDDGPADFDNIQEAINNAVNDDVIRVADGTYTGSNNKNLDFGGKAIVLESKNGPDNCIIDCQNNGRGFYFHSGEDGNSIVDGFTIRNGKVTGDPAMGGGIYCSGSSPAIINCNITNNLAQGNEGLAGEFQDPGKDAYGGGVYSDASSHPTIDNCKITDNTARGGLGGSYFQSGDPMCMGGYYYGMDGGNGYGGGVYCQDTTAINNCILVNNTAAGGDGGSGNSPPCGDDGDNGDGYGGGIYCLGNSSLTNSTIIYNSSDTSGGGIQGSGTTTIINSIVWGNDDDLSGCSATYSCIEDLDAGTGNIHSNPYFVSGPLGGYYLSQIAAGEAVDSPCVDAGSDTAANLGMDEYTTRTDQFGDTGTVDMGYHYPQIEWPDIDLNGCVDNFDYAYLAGQWQQVPGTPSADVSPLEGDGVVDINDLRLLADHWLWGCEPLFDPNANLVSWWEFEEGADSDANDSAGSNDGTLVGEPNWVAGQISSYALDFNGVGDYVDVPDDASLRFSQSDSFTISFWAKPVSNGCIISKMQGTDTSGIFGYMVYWDSAKDTFRFMAERSGTGTTIIETFDNSAPADSWYFVTVVYDNKNMEIYLDGQPHNSGTFGYNTGSTTPDKNLSIGVRRYGVSGISHYYEGCVDDVRIYNRALTDSEVQQLYQAGL